MAELEDGIAGYVKLGQVFADRLRQPRAGDQGPRGPPRPPAPRRRRARSSTRDRAARAAGARKLTLRVLGHNAPARDLYAACGFEVEGILRELFYSTGATSTTS